MIKCDLGKNVVQIKGTIFDCLAEYGVLSEQLIRYVPTKNRGSVAKALAKQLWLAVENALEGGENNEESE